MKRTRRTRIPKRTASKMQSEADALGSYTGTPIDGEEPEQDADDL